MSNNKLQTKTNIYFQQTKNLKNKPSLQNVRQDKRRLGSAAPVPIQPAAGIKITRGAMASKAAMVCSQNESVQQNRTVKTTSWLEPGVRASLERLARKEGLSISATQNAILKKHFQQHDDLQYMALLEPILQRGIAKNMRQIATRLSWLLVRVAFDAGQTRAIVTNILGNQLGAKQDLLKEILTDSAETAKRNITRRTPQMTELMEAIEKWLLSTDKERDAGR